MAWSKQVVGKKAPRKGGAVIRAPGVGTGVSPTPLTLVLEKGPETGQERLGRRAWSISAKEVEGHQSREIPEKQIFNPALPWILSN